MKKLLITGSGGFVGSNLKKYFRNKYEIIAPRSFELDLVNEKSVEDIFENNKFDYIIHCASKGGANGVVDAQDTVEVNLLMLDNILKYKNPKTLVITFGSGAMYGKTRSLVKIKESEIGDFVPKDLYGKSKMLMAKKIANREDVLCLNIFGCYGYNELATRFPTYAIIQKLQNKPIIIKQNVVFDYLFIEDLEKIVEQFLEQKPSENIINVTPTKSVSLVEIANIVNNFSENKVEIITQKQWLNYEYTGDNSVFLKNCQTFSFTEIELGLKKLYNYLSDSVCMI